MRIFLSHSSDDASIAESLKTLIETCSLGKAEVWFSSDTSSQGGISPGEMWFQELLSRIDACSLFLALLTPKSIDNLWLHYEAGCAATKGKPVVPLAAGVSVTDVQMPLAAYQGLSIGQHDGLKTLLAKMFQQHDISMNPLMWEGPIRVAHSAISAAVAKSKEIEPSGPSVEFDKLLRLMDRRFMEIMTALPKGRATAPSFEVRFAVTKEGKEIDSFAVDILPSMTLNDVTNTCYNLLDGKVPAFKYLEQWIIRDRTRGVNFIIRDVTRFISANEVLKAGNEYEIILLKKPYEAKFGPNQEFD